jgi:hypothetical protein
MYSTHQVAKTNSDYVLYNLVSANKRFRRINEGYEGLELEHYFCFGDGDDDWYMYNASSRKWEVLDNFIGDAVEEHNTFEEFFVAVVGGQI